MSFAADGDAAIASDETVEILSLDSSASELLSADYYFDSNVKNDTGNGSITSPYKEFKSSRIVSNSNLYLANGEYTLDKSTSIYNVTIIGQNPSKTILRYSGTGFTVSSSLTLQNLTLVNLRIVNNGDVIATNTVFKDYTSSSLNGGVIESQKKDSRINLNGCTFNNTLAKNGGAVYIKQGTLAISDSLFFNNRATENGGAISSSNDARISIINSKFLNGCSVNDGGGAMYLFKSELSAENMEISNCSSTFGGAITSINSKLNFNNFTGKNNRAIYDGGVIYALSEKLWMSDSILENNTAQNAGAIFVYNVDDFLIQTTRFTKNHANGHAGAFYSVFLNEPYYDSILDSALKNSFTNNTAKYENDVLEEKIPTLFIGSGDCLFILANSSDVSSIPSRYDLRELGQVTPAGSQGQNGNCWAFSSLGALESNVLKATGLKFDLSEENMKNLMALYSLYGWDVETNGGGYDDMGYAYLVSWLGPVNETNDPYKMNTILSPVLNSVIHVQNILFLTRENFTDNDDIKLALMKYGGVSTSMYMEQSKYLKDKKYYYYDGNNGQNHVGVIVGWDDDLEIPNAPGKGAWIVKNSWGTSWGEDGFYYVSYYDTKFAEVGKYESYVFVLNDTLKFDKNYQYDTPGKTDIFLNASDVAWYKNRFNATDNEYLAAVSTYFNEGTEWNLSVYVNNKLKLTQSGFETSRSYKTIDLNQLIKLNKGDIFEVEFKVITEGIEVGVPISEYIISNRKEKDSHFYVNTQFYPENSSFISYDGENWQSLYDLTWKYSSHIYFSQAACIKAFTVLNAVGTSLELKASNVTPNSAQLRAVVKNQYGALVKSGKVTFTIDGESIAADVKDGIASFTYLTDNPGTKTVTAKFSATGFTGSSNTTRIYMEKMPTQLTASKVTTTYNSGKNLVATLKDAENNPVVGVKVKIVLDSISKTVTTNDKGQASLSLNGIAPNSYTAKITFNGDDVYRKSNTTVSVVVNKADMDISAVYDYDNDKLVATLTNHGSGDTVSNVNVQVDFNGANSTVKSNSKGEVTVSTAGLPVGSYSATFSYAGSGKYNAASTKATFTVKTDIGISAVYDASKSRIIATLTSNATGSPISGAKVQVNLNGVTSTVKSNSKGQVTVSTSDLKSGTYTATFYYDGNSKYNPASTSVTFTTKINLVISAVYDAVNYQIVATLTSNATGGVISGANVQVDFNGVTSTVKSNTKGQVIVSTAGLPLGTYSATFSYAGNSKYNPASTTIKVDVKTKVIITDIYGDSNKLVASLTNGATGSPITNANMQVEIKGVTYTVKSDSKGKISLDTSKLGLTKYDVTISYAGNSKYNPSSATTNVDLNKANMMITYTYSASKQQLVATLKNSKTKKVVSGANMVIDINGVKTTLKSNTKGQITFSTAKLPAGTYVGTISYGGNSKYNPISAAFKVDV